MFDLRGQSLGFAELTTLGDALRRPVQVWSLFVAAPGRKSSARPSHLMPQQGAGYADSQDVPESIGFMSLRPDVCLRLLDWRRKGNPFQAAPKRFWRLPRSAAVLAAGTISQCIGSVHPTCLRHTFVSRVP